jgi:hypothetical protein
MGTLLFLVFELAVIHQTTDRRRSRGRDFNQIDIGLFGHSQSFADMNDSDRFVLWPDQTDFGDSDLAIDAVGSLLGDGG